MMKSPSFLKGVTKSTSDPTPSASVPAGQLRAVAWAAAPAEVAGPLPMQALTAPSAHLPVPPSPPTPSHQGFEPLASHASPAPMPPPPQPAPQELSPRVEAAIATLRLTGQRLAEQARSDALEVGLLVARRVLEREISTNLESLFSLIKSAIRRIGEARTTTVRVSAADFARLKDSEETSLTLSKVELVCDESLRPGDVMVDSEHTTVDGRLSTRLEELARALDDEET